MGTGRSPLCVGAGVTISRAATFGDTTHVVTMPVTAETGDVAVFLAYRAAGMESTTYTGWVKLHGAGRFAVFYRVVEAQDPGSTFPSSDTGTAGHVGVVYRGVAVDIPIVLDDDFAGGATGSPTARAIPSTIDADGPAPLVTFAGNARNEGSIIDPDLDSDDFDAAGDIVRRAVPTNPFALAAADWLPYDGPDPTAIDGSWTVDAFIYVGVLSFRTGNAPPNAPTLNFPVGSIVNPAVINQFDWTFSDPDDGDTQSQFSLEIREQGGVTAVYSTTDETSTTHHDIPAGELPVGDLEWRVKTWDAAGEEGPWSEWAQFTIPSYLKRVGGGAVYGPNGGLLRRVVNEP
jgi:hypothetical protein